MVSVNMSLLFIVSIWFRFAFSVPLDAFFPFGASRGESDVGPDSGDTIRAIATTINNFVFFNHNYREVTMYTDGSLVFYGPGFGGIGKTGEHTSVLIFSADVDTTTNGEMYFRLGSNANDIQKVNDIVNNAFQLVPDFNALQVVVATWDKVGYRGQQPQDDLKVNTFQCVVATDGTRTFAIYLYLDEGINWTTGADDNGVDGIGGNPAVVGFEKFEFSSSASTISFFIAKSGTEDIISIDDKSNVDNICHKGLYVFQVNGIEILTPSDAQAPVPVTCDGRKIQLACQLLRATVSDVPLQCQLNGVP